MSATWQTNKFGSGRVYSAEDLTGPIYALCCACLSVHSEFLGWANAHAERFVSAPSEAETIVVLGCQVTDLAVLNDLNHLRRLMGMHPKATFYVSGCLARRFDIGLPEGARRLITPSADYTDLTDPHLVNLAPPFWVKDFQEEDTGAFDLRPGQLFRHHYPLRIGTGCRQHCTYCTINVTRGGYKELDFERLKEEAQNHNPILLIADNTTAEQINEWCMFALAEQINLSFRNVEPPSAVEALKPGSPLNLLIEDGGLDIFHAPIQSNNPDVLRDMGRNVEATLQYVEEAKKLRSEGVITATNIIVAYKDFPDPKGLEDAFNYISWNPYWDGVWDEAKAAERMKRFLP